MSSENDSELVFNHTIPINPPPNEVWVNIFYGIVASFTILNNLIILIVIMANRTLHNSANLVMGSMFFAGILFATVYLIPRFVAPEMIQGNYVYCSLFGIIAPTTIVIINLHLMVISWDKYQAAHQPIEHRLTKHRKAAGVVSIVVIWSTALYVGLLPIILQFRPLNHKDCIRVNLHRIIEERIYFYLVVAIFFVLPFVIKTYCYISVFNLVRNSPAITDTCRVRRIYRHYKVAKVIATLVVVYFLMWAPFVVYILVQVTLDQNDYISDDDYGASLLQNLFQWRDISQCIAFTFPAISPVLYAYYIPVVRNCISNIIYGHPNRSDSTTRLTNLPNTFSNHNNLNRSNETVNSSRNSLDPGQTLNSHSQQRVPSVNVSHYSTSFNPRKLSNVTDTTNILNEKVCQRKHDGSDTDNEINQESYSTSIDVNGTDSSLGSAEEIDYQQCNQANF